MLPTEPSAPTSLPMPHLLVVDDETDIADSVARYFGKYGFRVNTAGEGNAVREIVQRETVDLILLDLGLPNEDGMELIRWLHEHWHGAIIILTGRGEAVDRIVGLELGADDYVTKPFDLRELLARARSVLRRTGTTPAAAPSPPPPPSSSLPPPPQQEEASYRFSGFLLDPGQRRLIDAADAEIPLTSGEFDLLYIFVRYPNRVLSRNQIMSEMRGRENEPFDRAIDVQIGRLRRKIEAVPSRPQLIKSVRNAGYLLAARVDRL